MMEHFTETLSRRLVLAVLLGGLLLFTYAILHSFLVPVAWAVILAYATWPIHMRLRCLLRGRRALAAGAMTLLLAAAFAIPLLWLALVLRTEMVSAYAALAEVFTRGPFVLPEFVADIPLLGAWLQEFLADLTREPAAMRAQIRAWIEEGGAEILKVLGGVGRNAVKLGFALITVFFLYRDGERVLYQAARVLHHFLGPRVDPYLKAVGGMTTAVVWGLVATAIGQGFVAGLGYWWFGLDAPVLLGALTALVAMIPFGTPFAWGSIGLWLLASGETFNGIGLLLWGTLVVSWVDNLIRPIVISSATRIPFLLVMFGVLGGLGAFGLIGLFVGPVVLAVLMAVWREWLEESPLADPRRPPAPPVEASDPEA